MWAVGFWLAGSRNHLASEAEIVVAGRRHTLRGGDLIILPAGQAHAVRAVSQFKMALTMIRSQPVLRQNPVRRSGG